MNKKKRVVKIEWYDPTIFIAPPETELAGIYYRGYGELEEFDKAFYLLRLLYPVPAQKEGTKMASILIPKGGVKFIKDLEEINRKNSKI